MPWRDLRAMSQKPDFIEKATASGANVAALCREYGIRGRRVTSGSAATRSRVRNTVGMDRDPLRLGATSGQKHSGHSDWRRQVVSLPHHRTADYVRCVCLTVNRNMAQRFVHLQDQDFGAELDLCCRGLSFSCRFLALRGHRSNPQAPRSPLTCPARRTRLHFPPPSPSSWTCASASKRRRDPWG